jgi:hypothetical protein
MIGHLVWSKEDRESGLTVRSLCGMCNSKCGSKYGSHFVDFIRKVAEQVENARDEERLIISGVRWPLSIVKAVMQSFISANGPDFVKANPWVIKFVRNSRNQQWPHDVGLYLFATNSKGGRKSGVMASYDFIRRRHAVSSEFVFWPLGAALFLKGMLSESRLTPIHHWVAECPYDYQGALDVCLWMNPAVKATPLDFRTEEQINKDASQQDEPLEATPETMEQMQKDAMRYGGEMDNKRMMFVTKTVPRIKH